MISSILSRLVILVFGTLYPAYASYKAVRTKNVKEYVKWMMYWIVFALFTTAETFTDVFLSWFPFYYEIKIIIVLWLLSPATKGSSILYRKFVHPALCRHEQEIDEYIARAKEQSYRQVLDIGTRGVSVLMQTALRGGGGLVNQLKKSYSLSDLNEDFHQNGRDEIDISDPRLKKHAQALSSATSMYFSEVDIRPSFNNSVQTLEDISSGYSSGEGTYIGHIGQPIKLQAREPISRTASLTRSRTTRVTRSTTKSFGSEDSDGDEVFDTNIVFMNDQMKPIRKLRSQCEEEFLDCLDDKLHDYGVNIVNNSSDHLTACDESTVICKHNDSQLDAERGGKYHKKLAPKPPLLQQSDIETFSPIKARLVLKPGKIREIENTCKNLFFPSPKLKRNILNKLSFASKLKMDFLHPNQSKSEHELSVPDSRPKRSSWHVLDSLTEDKKSVDGMSRSADDLLRVETFLVPLRDTNSSSRSFRQLTKSPFSKRRLKVLQTTK